MKYVYSTLANDNIYLVRKKGAGGAIAKKIGVRIKGGASVADPKTLITPMGVLTVLEDEKYELIKDDYSFKKHIERGFIKVESKKADANVVAERDMNTKDKSAQGTEDKIASKTKAKARSKEE